MARMENRSASGVKVPDYRRLYLRAWTEPPPQDGDRWQPPWPPDSPRDDRILVFDVETTVTVPQRLTFGFAALCEITRSDGRVSASLLHGWRFHADDLQASDPDGYRTLRDYTSELGGGECDEACCWHSGDGFPLLTQTEFLNDVFWGLAHQTRVPVVGFNLPFDLSMIARFARTRGDAFSFDLWGRPPTKTGRKWDRPPYRPGLTIRRRGNGHQIRFTGYAELYEADTIPEGSPDGQPHKKYRYRGHFWDLSQLAFALTAQHRNLRDTGEELSAEVLLTKAEEHGEINPEYISYNRHDVAATVSLFEQTMTEYERHPIGLLPEYAYSPASIGKAYLDAMGVIPPLRKWPSFPRDLLGRFAGAYYAGRSEMRGRHVSLPVVYSDAVAMFPTVCALVGVWDYDIADQLDVVDWTAQLQQLLDEVAAKGPDVVLDLEVWKTFLTVADIVPDGDVLPVRADYDDTPDNNKRVGVSHLGHDAPLPYTAPDLVASTLLTRQAPKVRRAWRLIPKGTQNGLRPVSFRGQVDIDPTDGDFYKFLVEDRYRWQTLQDSDPDAKWVAQGEKILNNALSYGAKMEFNAQHKTGLTQVTGYDGATFSVRVPHPEVPGRFCFPPLAATITGGARLFLALRERLTADADGTHYFCDTDSMALIATEDGGPVPCARPDDHHAATRTEDGRPAVNAIPWHTDDTIRERFNPLNPYDRDLIPDLWKVEKENYENQDPNGERRQLFAYGISAKRYTFHIRDRHGRPVLHGPDGTPGLIKPSEHGLGALLNPIDPDGNEKLAPHVWQYVIVQHSDISLERPRWLDYAAMRKEAVTTPHVWEAFNAYNEGKPYAQTIKPFSFMMSPNIGRGRLAVPARFVALYDRNPENWDRYDYIDIHASDAAPGRLLVQWARLDTLLLRWHSNPETVATGPDGRHCERTTVGLLSRRTIISAEPLVTLIGKEAGAVETEDHRAEDHASTHLTTYPRALNEWRSTATAVRRLGIAEIARRAGLSQRGLRKSLAAGASPHQRTRRAVRHAAANAVREELGLEWKDDLRVITAYVQTPRLCARCGAELPSQADSRRKYCKDGCSKIIPQPN